jgi:hypothetical protein
MHRVAGNAGYGVFHVAALNAFRVLRGIEMAREADFVGSLGGKFGRIKNLSGICRACVVRAGSVAGFAGMIFPADAGVRVHHGMGTLAEVIVNVFMAGLAGFGPNVFVPEFLRSLRGHYHEKQQERQESQPAKADVRRPILAAAAYQAGPAGKPVHGHDCRRRWPCGAACQAAADWQSASSNPPWVHSKSGGCQPHAQDAVLSHKQAFADEIYG